MLSLCEGDIFDLPLFFTVFCPLFLRLYTLISSSMSHLGTPPSLERAPVCRARRPPRPHSYRFLPSVTIHSFLGPLSFDCFSQCSEFLGLDTQLEDLPITKPLPTPPGPPHPRFLTVSPPLPTPSHAGIWPCKSMFHVLLSQKMVPLPQTRDLPLLHPPFFGV